MQHPSIPKTLPSFFFHFLKKHWLILLLVQFFSFAWSIDHTLWPYVIMVLIDTITNFTGSGQSEAWHALARPISMGISLWITIEIFFRLSGILGMRMFPKIEASIRMSMFDYVLGHSHRYFGNHLPGTIANKISDMSLSMTRILELIIHLFVPVLLALVISTVLFANINTYFALILLGWIAVHVSICFHFSKKCANASRLHAESRSLLFGKIVDCLSNSSNVRIFARNRFEHHYLSHFQKDERKKHTQSLWMIEKMKIALGIATFFGAAIAINGYMLYLWTLGQLTAGEVVFIFNTSWNITMMAWLAGLELPHLFREIGVCKQALSIIEDTHDIPDRPGAIPLSVDRGEIVFDKVTFRFLNHQNLFENKTIKIEAGQKVGLVGFSGSGKSTFVNLILRYYDVQGGSILVDGQDISKVTQDSLRSQISLIPQDPSLFHRSLMENIRYGRPEASDEEVIEASKRLIAMNLL